ncbi:hypothetical protein ACQP1P_06780 [Dactylosporangium sp. CA-052675]|uniref:hypothetical protein n=1 Tax=Dactylosporangium sp. CA-052675 TaxID=3239927 RepID=UPI003D8AAE0B
MTSTFRRNAPAPWAEGIKRSKRVAVRPTGAVAAGLLGLSVLVALAVAGWAIKELSILWGAAAILALAGVVVLTLRGFPLFAILTIAAGAVAWGVATRGRLPDSWLDLLGVLGFLGINLAYVVPLAGAFLSALLLDARRVSRSSIDEAVSGRRWWGKPDDTLPRLKELEAIPSSRFFALGEGGCTHLVSAGRRVALFLPTVWPHGEFTMDAAGQVLRGGRLFVPGSEDVDGLAAEVHTWREQLAKVGGSVRGYLVVAPSRGDVSEDLVISVAPGEHLHLVHAHEMADAAGRWLAAEPYRVDLHVMERLLVLAAGNELPEPLSLPRTFAREATASSGERSDATSPTDAAFAAAASSPSGPPAAAGMPTVLGGAGEPTAPTTAWRPGNGVMRARLSRLAKSAAARGEHADATIAGSEPAPEPPTDGNGPDPATPEAALRSHADSNFGPASRFDRDHDRDADFGAPSRRDRDADYGAPARTDRDPDFGASARAGRDSDFGAASGFDRDRDHGSYSDFGASARAGNDSDFGASARAGNDSDFGASARAGRDSDFGVASGYDASARPNGEASSRRGGDASARGGDGAAARDGASAGGDVSSRKDDDPESSWEARLTRELVGNWDNDSASRLAAWAAEDTSEPDARASARRAWSPMGGETPAPGERFRWSSEAADDFPVAYEAGNWLDPATDAEPARADARRETRTTDASGDSRTPEPDAESRRENRASERDADSWRDSRAPEPGADSWRDSSAPEPGADSWRDSSAPEPVADTWRDSRAPEPVAEPSWRETRTPEPVADSWRENRAPEPVVEPSWRQTRTPEPVADSWRENRAPEPVQEPWRDRRAPEPVAETRAPEPVADWRTSGREPWASDSQDAGRADERPVVEWPPPAESRGAERLPVDWRTPDSSAPEQPSVDWQGASEPSSVDWQAASERPSVDWQAASERPSVDWQAASERPSVDWQAASERPSVDWQAASERPSVEWRSAPERPSVEWRSATEAGPSQRPSVEWRSGEAPAAGRGADEARPSARPSVEWQPAAENGATGRPSVEWRPAAENGASGRPSVEWQSAGENGASARPSVEWQPAAERPSVEWQPAAERPSVDWQPGAEAGPSGDWRAAPQAGAAGGGDWRNSEPGREQQPTAGEARRRPERAAFTGSLFDGDAPELVAKPLELRRSWESSDAASRSIRRRDRQQAPEGESVDAREQGRTASWPSVPAADADPMTGMGQPIAAPSGNGRTTDAWENQAATGSGRAGDSWEHQAGSGRAGDSWEHQAGSGRAGDSWESQAGSGRAGDSWESQAGSGRAADAWDPRSESPAGRGPNAQGQAAAPAAGGWNSQPWAPHPSSGREAQAQPDHAAGGAASTQQPWEAQAPSRDEPATQAWPSRNGRTTDAWESRPQRAPREAAPPPAGRGGEEAWWDGSAQAPVPPPVVDGGGGSGEKTKKSRWGRNKDKDKKERSGPEETAGAWASEPGERWDNPGAPRNGEPGNEGWDRAAPSRNGEPGNEGWDRAAPSRNGEPGNEGWDRAAPPRNEEPGNEGWDRAAPPRNEEPRNQGWERAASRSEEPGHEGWNGGERIPEQRKREQQQLSAFEDLAPLELNLDEEPKEKTRRFLRRK